MIVLVMLEYILVICLLVMILILLVPIFFHFQVSKYHDLIMQVKVNWLFNTVYCYIKKEGSQYPEIILTILGIQIPIKRRRLKKKEKEKIKKEKRFNFRMLLNRSFLIKIFKFIRKILRHIIPREFRVRLFYGFDNPADTGVLCGFVALLSAYVPQYDIQLNPVFNQKILEGELFLKGRVFCFVLAYYILQLVLSRTFWKTIKKARKIN